MLLGVQVVLYGSNSPPIMGISAENELKEQWKTGSPVGTANGTTLETWKSAKPVLASSTCRKVSMESFTLTISILSLPAYLDIPRTSWSLSVEQLFWSTSSEKVACGSYVSIFPVSSSFASMSH